MLIKDNMYANWVPLPPQSSTSTLGHHGNTLTTIRRTGAARRDCLNYYDYYDYYDYLTVDGGPLTVDG